MVEQAAQIAREWVEAWNSRDLERVLAHYTDDFEMTSPYIVRFTGEASGTLVGKQQVAEYWKSALERLPNLHFTLLSAFASVDSVVIYYQTGFAGTACEVLFLAPDGRVRKGIAHYEASPNP